MSIGNRWHRIRTIAIVAVAAAEDVTAWSHPQAAGQLPAWPPPFQTVATDQASIAKSPADEAKTFHLPPGYHAELVASEPLVIDPIFIDWDANGRMWVIEEVAYMPELNPSNEREHEPVGRIVV